MLNPTDIKQLIQQMMEDMPPAIKGLPEEAKANIRAALQGGLNQLDLVTREEFDAQSKVLLKTREKLDALEKQIQQLEKDR